MACAGLRQGVAFTYEGCGTISPHIVTLRRPKMAVRIPESLSTSLQPETGWSVLDHELREQKAHALGPDREHRRRALLDGAADLVWAFMIQRELCGFRNWDAVVKDYRISREVLNRAGQVRCKAD